MYRVTVMSKGEKDIHTFNNFPSVINKDHYDYLDEVKDVMDNYRAIYSNSIPPIPVIILKDQNTTVYIYKGDLFSIEEIESDQ